MNDDLVCGAAAAADYTGLSRRVIYRLTDEGLLPVVRMGRRLYYLKSSLKAAFRPHEMVAA